MARRIEDHPKFVALEAELQRVKRLLSDALRFTHLVGPALAPLVGGELGMMQVTNDYQAVTMMNGHVTVTLNPSTEEIRFEGIGTNHRLSIIARDGKITADQAKAIAFVIFSIKQVRGRKPDPMLLADIDLFGREEVMTGA